ncbi:hypothetical protein KKG48_00655 [Patescibacteria group bacterium]|nr:hypothetical protein [Patescibacteria group bacterium]MCG2694889.1 hypothetical protein [Candidatus Parcubacteria bacterium]
MSHQFSKYWPKRHSESEKKWRNLREDIVEFKEKSHNYNCYSNRWLLNRVIESCGYCKEFSSCFRCPLWNNNFCYSGDFTGKETIFWIFVEEIREKEKPDFRKALGLATKMLMRIREDRPLANFHHC